MLHSVNASFWLLKSEEELKLMKERVGINSNER